MRHRRCYFALIPAPQPQTKRAAPLEDDVSEGEDYTTSSHLVAYHCICILPLYISLTDAVYARTDWYTMLGLIDLTSPDLTPLDLTSMVWVLSGLVLSRLTSHTCSVVLALCTST